MSLRDRLEEGARAIKVLALLEVLDRESMLSGIPHLAGPSGIEALKGFDANAWAALAREAGVVPPSPETVAVILEHVRRRGGARDARRLKLVPGGAS